MKSKPRVLLVGPFPPTTGGVTTFLLNLMAAPVAARVDFVPFTTSRPPKKRAIAAYGYGVLLSDGVGRLIVGALVTLGHVARFPFDVILRRIDLVQIQASDFQTFWESAIYLGLARLLRRPTLLRLGGSFNLFYETASGPTRRLIAWVLTRPDRLIVQSEYWRAYVAQRGRTANVVVLPNFVIEQPAAPERAAAPDIPVCLFIAGREAVMKGLDPLIEAMAALDSVALRWHLVAVLPGSAEKLPRLGPETLLIDSILDRGSMARAYAGADIFLLPSLGEGFPNSLLEAMAHGLPVVATPVGAVPEVLDDGVGGYLVPPGDGQALAARIATLAADPGLRARMGAHNRRIVATRYLAGPATAPLVQAYDELLGSGGRP